jgi:uncharacterized membrane protein YhaH (DUF805 family)
MNMGHILFNDEGHISRREWWAGTIVLMLAQTGLGWLSHRYLDAYGAGQAAALFVSIVLLIPFYSVNVKRLQALGLPSWVALWMGALALVAILSGAFLPGHAINIPLGLALLCVIVGGAIWLGFYEPPPQVSPTGLTARVTRPSGQA